MAEFLPPSMPEPIGGSVSPEPETDAAATHATTETRSELPRPIPTPVPTAQRTGPGPLGRLISLVISVGLAWALVIAITAWLLGLFLTRG